MKRGSVKRGNSRQYFNNINMLPKSKRSQVTIFIILAIAIVVVLVLIFLRRGDISIIPAAKTPIDSIKECSSLAVDELTSAISQRGGSLEPKLFYLYNGNKVEYLCYADDFYQKCVMQKPLLKESIEKDMEKNLVPKISDCLAFQREALEKKGYSVSYKTPNITVDLVPNNILVSVDSDLKISKTKTEVYKTFRVDKTSKMYDFSMITSSILNWEARYGDSEIMNYMIYYPSLRVEKKKMELGTTIYILTDKDSGEKFIFASRSMAVPAGITGK